MVSKELKLFIKFPDIFVILFLTITGCIVSILHWQGWLTLIFIVAGMVAYALAEYTTHRFLFHMKPPKNRILLKFLKRIHYDHHANPGDLHLLFLPLWYSLPNIAVASSILMVISHRWQEAIFFATGVGIFLLYYEWRHFVAHRPLVPKTKWGKKLKKSHLWHHYKNENYWYGVTHTVLDYVFQTYPDEKLVEKSQTARDLEHRIKEQVTESHF